ncbi:hypothetical protein GGI25_005134 [Coemansia spiralis]|uniref:Uncharacterized protein n=2 Tax=Coemansia TaxID=4863 RepID=A0A9W8FZ43_9FUNG|nr:hypothetical protein EDC05_005065 [Coemansia umbellata]KAJ2620029.1 hypothetical protein GGI26_005323 [Coemansia sp. RSA 1358]KAJ2672372.1 hypothetical protein GGI25_005134 [Coemansia spiralis]
MPTISFHCNIDGSNFQKSVNIDSENVNVAHVIEQIVRPLWPTELKEVSVTLWYRGIALQPAELILPKMRGIEREFRNGGDVHAFEEVAVRVDRSRINWMITPIS